MRSFMEQSPGEADCILATQYRAFYETEGPL